MGLITIGCEYFDSTDIYKKLFIKMNFCLACNPFASTTFSY